MGRGQKRGSTKKVKNESNCHPTGLPSIDAWQVDENGSATGTFPEQNSGFLSS